MMRLDPRQGGNRNRETLVAALARFAQVGSEAELLELLQDVMAAQVGTADTLLLTREPAAAADVRLAGLTGTVPPRHCHVSGPAVDDLLELGAIFTSDAPETDLPGVPVPSGTGSAIFAPSAPGGATTAVCGFWAERPPMLGSEELATVRLLAGLAGLAHDRLLARTRARILRAALEKRVRNVLAVIRSVGTRSAERASSIEDFLMHFEGRVDAIGRSQFVVGRDGEISFEHLLREELLAQTIQDGEDVSLDGLDVAITSGQAEALGLAMHELAVNAMKFGAFSAPGGSLTLRWWVEGSAGALVLTIDWRERCGPSAEIVPPARSGFGLTYLERALPFQLNAETMLDFDRQGLRCRITVPLDSRPGLRARPIPDRHGASHPLNLNRGPVPFAGGRWQDRDNAGNDTSGAED